MERGKGNDLLLYMQPLQGELDQTYPEPEICAQADGTSDRNGLCPDCTALVSAAGIKGRTAAGAGEGAGTWTAADGYMRGYAGRDKVRHKRRNESRNRKSGQGTHLCQVLEVGHAGDRGLSGIPVQQG